MSTWINKPLDCFIGGSYLSIISLKEKILPTVQKQIHALLLVDFTQVSKRVEDFSFVLRKVGPFGVHELRHDPRGLIQALRVARQAEKEDVDVPGIRAEARSIRHVTTWGNLLVKLAYFECAPWCDW